MHVVYGSPQGTQTRADHWTSMCEDDGGSECLCSGLWGLRCCHLFALVTDNPNSLNLRSKSKLPRRWSDWSSSESIIQSQGNPWPGCGCWGLIVMTDAVSREAGISVSLSPLQWELGIWCVIAGSSSSHAIVFFRQHCVNVSSVFGRSRSGNCLVSLNCEYNHPATPVYNHRRGEKRKRTSI